MDAKRLKSDLVELCRQRGLHVGRSTKEQLIAQLEERDRLDEPSPVPEGSRPVDAVWALGPDMAGRGQTAAKDIPRPCLPIPRGGVGGSPANTEGTLTPAASRGSSRRSSLSREKMRLECDREMRREELELRKQELKPEREEKEKQRQHELELARPRSSGAPAAVSEGGPKTAKSFDKCFLALRKEGEDMDTFLTAFENTCELLQVDPADRLQFLIPSLDPTAREVYSRLKGAETGDYELFKKALLREFGLTPETYRQRFRNQRKTREVTYLQLANRAQGYARKWTAGAQTMEDLLDLFVLEHVYEQCPPDLRRWLMDQKPENPQHTGQLADEFVNSRAGDNREESQRNRPATTQRESHHGTSQRGNMENAHQRGTSSVRSIQPAQGDPWDMGCYHCGQRGHIRAQCFRLRDRLSGPNPQRVDWVETQPGERQHSQGRGAGSVPPAKDGGELQDSSSGGLDAPDSGFLVYTPGPP
ncbi:uncharacterized protein LOC101946761 isoform X2 [Chrysemys picta bellii]|uniref:uncharacterized protein LOC101946761 isoform X2 n=1 Tax=Chrysemys picta bellii TaxID=8478 RepID=UPI0032B0FADC